MIDRYIVDFYCHEAKLVIELDGSQHYEPDHQKLDEERSNILQKHGLTILRFSNLDVNLRFAEVCEAIDLAVKQNGTGF